MFLGKKNKGSAVEQSRIEELEKENRILKEALAAGKTDILLHPGVMEKALDLGKLGYWIQVGQQQNLILSERALEILGKKGKKTLSLKELQTCIHPDDVVAMNMAINSSDADSKPVELEFRIISMANEIREIKYCFFRGLRFLLPDVNQFCLIGIIGDHTSQEKSKRELIRAKERAEESERLKNTWLANISHEIRTPMNSIIGFSELLKIGNLSFEKKREYVNTIRNQGNLLLKFIDDIAELIQFESGKVKISKTKCNLNILLKELFLNANQQKAACSKENIEIRLVTPDKKGLILLTDPGRLQQVISNLISNAIKFTEKGYIEFGYAMPVDDKIEFFVKDTGIGLSKEQQKNIFNRFAEEEYVDQKFEGSGLGLTISKHLVKLMGGKIGVDSEPGKGAIFHFSLPFEVASSDNDYATIEDEHLPVYKWKDKVILAVEDDDINFRFLEAILNDTDSKLIHATSGSQAVELCRSINKIDLVLMDIKLPEMDGFEATLQIRQFNKKIPIIAQTAFALEIDMEKCLSVGCNDYMAKPIEIKEFLEKINTFLKE